MPGRILRARWVPNLVLGPFGILALIWRARWAEGRLPFRAVKLPQRPPAGSTAGGSTRTRRRRPGAGRAPSPAPQASRGRDPRAALPRCRTRTSSIATSAGIYLRVAGLSFVALLGLFYICTFIDKSDKMFKGQATTGDGRPAARST